MKALKIFDSSSKPSEQEVVDFIKSDGVVVIPNFCTATDLEKLKDEYHSILVGNHQDNDWFQNRPYSLGVAAILSKTEGMKKEYPFSFNFFLNPSCNLLLIPIWERVFNQTKKYLW